MDKDLKAKISAVPALPGIYQFLNKDRKIIYIGKAKNLRSRIHSYFRTKLDSPKTEALVSKVNDFDIIATENEIEALVLENNLIKKHKPRYNVNLKDDKTYPYIRVTKEPYPQIFPTRDVIQDGSRYFGPYTDVKSMKASLRLINKTFKIRSCTYQIDEEVIKQKKIKVCLDYHIKKCDGPCEGLITTENYGKMVDQVVKVLRGKTNILLDELKEEMFEASQKLNFEKAGELRDKIEQLRVYSEKQKIVTNDFDDKDIVSIAVEAKDVACTILIIRNGRLVGKRQLKLNAEIDEELDKIYNAALKFYYGEFVEIPQSIILEILPFDNETLLEWLNSRSDRKVKFVVPKIQSEAKSLLHMCKQNAILQLKDIQLQKMKKEGNLPYVLSSLKRDLRLTNLPRKIECFDISNLQGTDTVASMVVFVDGKPKKSLYRKYIIKSVDGPNDFASMQEVIERRYSRLIEENEQLPDLIMVDGGKGQLSSAVEILDNLGIKNYEIIGLAKRLEEVFFPGISEAQTIPKTSSSLKLLQHLRDEAHRFAITFHRKRRDGRTLQTELTEIKGIGKKVAEKLLQNFNSINEIKLATEEELTKIIGPAKSKLLVDFYNSSTEKDNL
ncbi:MAG: excinuclease ABC subunit C [Ignavibacteriae bacterium]|nr:excinuclease ABC subunit C [Ignavibacteriota bacterium]MCB9218695.1 excinuclease ABC subunit C [Ignavibacteriales bacterium]